MKTKAQEYKKEEWGPGPWQNEPDRMEWEAHGLPCLAVRNHFGVWCGYVAVAPGHSAFKKGYDDVDVQVHGGLTYADNCQGHICHVPKPGQPDNVWWLGFDCGHWDDLNPGMLKYGNIFPISAISGTYRDQNYVRAETERLAEQLAAMK